MTDRIRYRVEVAQAMTVIRGVVAVGLFAGVVLGACGADKTFNVRDHGAKGSHKTSDQPAIQSAVDACVAAGGGRVVFPAGDYLCGGLRLAGAAAAFKQQPRSAFCGRHIDGLKVRNVRRKPQAESVGAVDLQDCRAAGETR